MSESVPPSPQRNHYVSSRTNIDETSSPPPRRSTRGFGGIITAVESLPVTTGSTPTRNVKRQIENISDGNITTDFRKRWKLCCGRMAKVEDFITTVGGKTERVRHPCGYCDKALTSWYCLGCKGWFCMEPSYSNKGKKGSGPLREKEMFPVQVVKKKMTVR